MEKITPDPVNIPTTLQSEYLRKVNAPQGPRVEYSGFSETEFRKMLSIGANDFTLYRSCGRTRSVAEHYARLPKGVALNSLKSALAVVRIGRWKWVRMIVFASSDTFRVGYRKFGILYVSNPNRVRVVGEQEPVFLGPGHNFVFVC